MNKQHEYASLVMMRPGVQFSLAAPAVSQYLQQVPPFHRPLASVESVQLCAERFKNTQIDTGNIRAICSRSVPAAPSVGGAHG